MRVLGRASEPPEATRRARRYPDEAVRPFAAVHVRNRLALFRPPRNLRPMTGRARKIIDEALTLPTDELIGLVAELQDRVEETDSQEDIDAAWSGEIARRLRAVQAGTATLIDGDQVERELAEILEEG